MGSKFWFYCFGFFLILLNVVISSTSAYQIANPDPTDFGEPLDFELMRSIVDGSYGVRVQVGKIPEALWDADYKIMSLILQSGQCEIIPASSYSCYLSHNLTVTLFAPPDEAFLSDNWKTTTFHLQISDSSSDVLNITTFKYSVFPPPGETICLDSWKRTRFYVRVSKVADSESLAKGTDLFSCAFPKYGLLYNDDPKYGLLYNDHQLMVAEAPASGDPWINLNITRPNIFNDGHVIVHGVDNY